VLEGSGPVPTSFEDGGDGCSADRSDEKRFRTADYALRRQEQPYKLFLAHFSDVDMQGHCYGVTKEYNERDSYQAAVTNKTRLITSLLQAVNDHPLSNDTVVIVTSDHGHIDAGGHGGNADVLRDVPLIVYKK
jgi:predicted AlkP superfamily pyrophosphatase or phosphodiesterase